MRNRRRTDNIADVCCAQPQDDSACCDSEQSKGINAAKAGCC